MLTRIPIDPNYATALGKAVYAFAYYEWAIIYLIEHIEVGFVAMYSRGKPMTSGGVKKAFDKAIENPLAVFSVLSKCEMEKCRDTFAGLVEIRNALIHAHPGTDSNGSQILFYQASLLKTFSDVKWPEQVVTEALKKFDEAAVEAGMLLDRVRKSADA